MGETHSIPLVRPLAGLLAPDLAALQQGQEALARLFGPIAQASEEIPFRHTTYYEKEMGKTLLRQFLIFQKLRPPEELADWKQATNAMEQQLGRNEQGGRRVNLDPGYLAPGRLVLASTKDHEQRIYLRLGIYAENTLRIRNHCFYPWDWTYPDYAEARGFFDQAYQAYLRDLSQG